MRSDLTIQLSANLCSFSFRAAKGLPLGIEGDSRCAEFLIFNVSLLTNSVRDVESEAESQAIEETLSDLGRHLAPIALAGHKHLDLRLLKAFELPEDKVKSFLVAESRRRV